MISEKRACELKAELAAELIRAGHDLEGVFSLSAINVENDLASQGIQSIVKHLAEQFRPEYGSGTDPEAKRNQEQLKLLP
jgi:hypothetical protein